MARQGGLGLSITAEKRMRYQLRIYSMLEAQSTTRQAVESIIGTSLHMAPACPRGKRRLIYRLFRTLHIKTRYMIKQCVKLGPRANLEKLRFWMGVLQEGFGAIPLFPMVHPPAMTRITSIVLWQDASLDAGGGFGFW